jgi:2-keto-4-pentenoate hydratase
MHDARSVKLRPVYLMKQTLAVLFLIFFVGPLARAVPPAREAIKQLAEDYFALRPSQALTRGMTQEEAFQAQKDFVERLSPKLGNRVGYKAGLVTQEAQQRFGINSPVRGVLLSRMLLKDGAEVPANFGVRPLCEADLVVVVKDKGINDARTPLDVARHLTEVVAFIELPDAFLSTNQPMDAGLFIASNAGARLGILGERLPVKATPEFVTAMAKMVVTMTDQTGADLGKAEGKVILDNPLNAVLWLIRDLARTGQTLKPGDLLSLGSLKAIPPQAGQSITVRYEGLPGRAIRATVHFR